MSDMFSRVAAMAVGKPLKWVQVNKYALTRGTQTIAKCYLDGCTLYVLHDGDKRIGHYESADDAKAAADQFHKVAT